MPQVLSTNPTAGEARYRMDQAGVEDVIIRLLAEHQHKTADELLQELLAAGDDLPIDSVLAAEIVGELQEYFRVRMPTAEVPEYLRSVRAFAAKICALVAAKEVRGA